MASLTLNSVAQGPYLYNGFGQLASRTVTGNPTKTFAMLYDQDGNLIAEADAATGEILREYFWLGGRPVAVMDSAADHAIYAVHVDQLDRPVMMTDWTGAIVWRADYLPFGEVRTSSGPRSLNLRFPGQWFMLETGLHYNWHRWYDASTGRYTQPDPIGMPDGPSRYAYVLNSPLMGVDREGQMQLPIGLPRILGKIFDDIWGDLGKLWNDESGEGKVCTPSNDPDDCASRWEREQERCGERMWEYAHQDFYSACMSRAMNRFVLCMGNGGVPHPQEPPEWGINDEEVWRNQNR